MGYSPFPDTWPRLQHRCSTGAVSTDANNWVCATHSIYGLLRDPYVGRHPVECHSQHNSAGPQHPPSPSQAAGRNSTCLVWWTKCSIFADLKNWCSQPYATHSGVQKKTTCDCTREKTCYLHDEFIRTDVFSSKSCCTYELNLMLHCLVADRDNTKHNAIYRFVSS